MVGIDIVKIERIEKFYEKHGTKAYERFLNAKEIQLVKSPQSAAGFWAAKEAISKALGTGIGAICSFSDIIIHKDDNGRPYFTLSKKIVDDFSIISTALSIAHDGGFAIAVASIESQKSENLPLWH